MVDATQSPPPSPPEQTEFASHRRAYDAPGLSPRGFLLAVMHDPSVPIRDRMDAASKLLRLYGENSFKPPRFTYIIPEFPHACARATDLGSPDTNSFTENPDTENPEQINGNSQSKSASASYNLQPQLETPAPLNTERYPDPSNFIDYSIPPSPEEIREMKAVIQRLQPNLDLSQLPEPRLCACGHWMFYPCKCVSIH